MQIITGYRGEGHITSNDHQAFNYGVIGDCILPVGRKLEHKLETYNELRIYDGEIIHKGVHSRVLPGTYDTVTLENGEQDMKRIDLVCVKYSKAANNVETSEWVVKKGTPTTGTAVEPAYTTGDIVSGDTVDETPVFKVTFNSLAPTVTPLLKVSRNIKTLTDDVTALPKVLFKSTVVVNGTSADDITLCTIPSGYDVEKMAITVTNPLFNTNPALPIATYIDGNRRAHAKMNVSRVSGYCRLNYIVWYWG